MVATAPDTVIEAVQLLQADGYTGDFQISRRMVCCTACATDHPFAGSWPTTSTASRGESDPGDEAIVIG